MKNIYITIIFLFCLTSAFTQGIGGVQADITQSNIALSFTLGILYPPLSVTTIWTDDNGNQETCDDLCDLDSVFDDIKPGRYCVQIILSQYNDVDFASNGQEGPCTHELMTITECFDIKGGTCGTTGNMSNSGISCNNSTTGTASWGGVLADCLAFQNGKNNAKFTWTTGRTNATPQTPLSAVTSINGLSPGKYCVKITPFNSDGDDCDCTAYYCTEIGSLEVEPLTISARITPMRLCYINGKPSSVLSSGSIRVSASGGFTLNGYSSKWIGNTPPATIPASGANLTQEFRYCVEFSDDCGTKVTKCFTIPKVRVNCFPDPWPPGQGPIGGSGLVTQTPATKLAPLELGAKDSEPTQSLKLYPNPANSQLNLEFTAAVANPLAYVVIGVDGSRMLEGRLSAGSGEWKRTIDVSQLPNGVYYLQIAEFQTERFIIIH